MADLAGNGSGLAGWMFRSLWYDSGDPLFFTQPFFLLFLFVFFATLLPFAGKPAARNRILLAFSLWFYYKCSGLFVLLLIATGILNFLLAIRMEKTVKQQPRWWLIATGLTVNLLLLGSFKYTAAASAIAGWLPGGFSLAALAFPAGISFYTFVNLGYLLDVAHRRVPACRSLDQYLAFITFFPAVQMGPIERAGSFIPQLNRPYNLSKTDAAEGFYLVFTGAVKKMVIGDFVNLHLVTQVLGMPERHTGMEVLAAIFGYSLVIYCDFSGYTDMARGIARWAGFNLRVNFLFPYRAKNIGDFWNRWHISLSSWLRDYLFLPMAYRLSGKIKREYLIGNRFLRTDLVLFAFSALVTFTLCGAWHGTGWNFLLWGMMHGVALGLQRGWSYVTREHRRRRRPGMRQAGKFMGTVVTFLFVSAAWVFFRSPTPGDALGTLRQVGANFYPEGLTLFLRAYYPVLAMIVAGYLLHFLPIAWHDRLRGSLVNTGWFVKALIAVAMIALIAWFRSQGAPMPIYIQF
ncbi:MAG TPA: MBOAT family O-acyltransferase [Bacteroidales bacterium]|nr:MBOAT family O-acyltransferase [Bacteroidales bacterium]